MFCDGKAICQFLSLSLFQETKCCQLKVCKTKTNLQDCFGVLLNISLYHCPGFHKYLLLDFTKFSKSHGIYLKLNWPAIGKQIILDLPYLFC